MGQEVAGRSAAVCADKQSRRASGKQEVPGVGFFLFEQKTAYEMSVSDWSSDVCSSDLSRKARRVAVAPFENQTSNRALEPIGHLTSDWITQGLAEAGFAEVVDPQTVQLAMGNTPLGVRGLASATGARLIVSGTYYLEGDSLRFLARVTDASLDKLLRVIGP